MFTQGNPRSVGITLRKRGRTWEDEEGERNGRGPLRQVQLTDPKSILQPLTIRDRLLQKEVMELNPEVLPTTVRVHFPNPHVLYSFYIRITPSDGIWKGGVFDFEVFVPEDYNMCPPKVKCLTRAWHPNISNDDGDVCLSLLRSVCYDGFGWTPTRRLKDVVLGLEALFGDLANFDDPLNTEVSQLFTRDRERFYQKVQEFIQLAHPRTL